MKRGKRHPSVEVAILVAQGLGDLINCALALPNLLLGGSFIVEPLREDIEGQLSRAAPLHPFAEPKTPFMGGGSLDKRVDSVPAGWSD